LTAPHEGFHGSIKASRHASAGAAIPCPRLLDATRDAEEVLHEALGSKKLKELRRQRNRLG